MPGIAAEPQLLCERLDHWAGERAERPCFTFLGDDGQEAGSLTYAGLQRRATVLARALVQTGLRGSPVLLCVDGSDFAVSFCGCLLAGAIAVPLPATATRRIHERLQRIITDSGATGAVIPTAHPLAAELRGRGLRLVDPATVASAAEQPDLPAPTPSAPAFLQYTSGSTGSPKGVVVTHANLAHGAALIGDAFRTTEEDIGVSWLPLHHDMGLVGSIVHIIHRGMRCVHLTPRAMVARPACWLRAISRYRATISGGPDFAYRLLVERTTPEDLRGLDLSCWRIAYTGAEPVRPDTMRRVAGLLAGSGFRERAILPCYGLAEATLIVAGGPPELGVAIARPDGATSGPQYVSCGAPVPAGSVAVVDPDSGLPCREGTVGEIVVAGPHVSPGYWRTNAPPDDAGRLRLPGDARSWYRTGDLGFLHQGGVHISGRIKDLLIINGVKHHAEDVESTVQCEVQACARGTVTAVQVPAGDGPHLVIAVELPQPPSDPDGLVSAVSSAVWRQHGLCVDRVLLERTGRLPRTSSGKIRRATTRELIEQGRIGAAAGRT